MGDEREIEQSVEPVGIDERPVWGVNISNWGNSPTSVSGNIITFSPFVPQAVGDNYRIEFKFTIIGGSILEGYAYVDCE